MHISPRFSARTQHGCLSKSVSQSSNGAGTLVRNTATGKNKFQHTEPEYRCQLELSHSTRARTPEHALSRPTQCCLPAIRQLLTGQAASLLSVCQHLRSSAATRACWPHSEPCLAQALSLATQGVIIKRHKILKEDRKTPFGIEDFVVGERVTLYGKTVQVVDADPYTRRHLEAKGVPVNPAQEYPDTPFAKTAALAQRHTGEPHAPVRLTVTPSAHLVVTL